MFSRVDEGLGELLAEAVRRGRAKAAVFVVNEL
jgi:hypothetical protein